MTRLGMRRLPLIDSGAALRPLPPNPNRGEMWQLVAERDAAAVVAGVVVVDAWQLLPQTRAWPISFPRILKRTNAQRDVSSAKMATARRRMTRRTMGSDLLAVTWVVGASEPRIEHNRGSPAQRSAPTRAPLETSCSGCKRAG